MVTKARLLNLPTAGLHFFFLDTDYYCARLEKKKTKQDNIKYDVKHTSVSRLFLSIVLEHGMQTKWVEYTDYTVFNSM